MTENSNWTAKKTTNTQNVAFTGLLVNWRAQGIWASGFGSVLHLLQGDLVVKFLVVKGWPPAPDPSLSEGENRNPSPPDPAEVSLHLWIVLRWDCDLSGQLGQHDASEGRNESCVHPKPERAQALEPCTKRDETGETRGPKGRLRHLNLLWTHFQVL